MTVSSAQKYCVKNYTWVLKLIHTFPRSRSPGSNIFYLIVIELALLQMCFGNFWDGVRNFEIEYSMGRTSFPCHLHHNLRVWFWFEEILTTLKFVIQNFNVHLQNYLSGQNLCVGSPRRKLSTVNDSIAMCSPFPIFSESLSPLLLVPTL